VGGRILSEISSIVRLTN